MTEVTGDAVGTIDRAQLAQDSSTVSLPDAGERFTVQQAAALTGLSEHNLRYYERVGLLEPVHRDPSSGHRRYSPGDIVRCETLTCLRAAGLSLDEMRRYFELRSLGARAAPEQIALLESHEAVLEDRLRRMQRHLENLRLKIAYWRAVGAGEEQAAAEISREFSARIRQDASDTHRTPDHDR